VGLFGDDESGAFTTLPPVPAEITLELCRLALDHLLPAAEAGRFDEFSESLFRYGRLAGECFSAKQGGPFASGRLADLVETIQRLGAPGVGQSSWGPTLFALLRDEAAAAGFVDALRREPKSEELEISITAANNTGARVEVV
jgi:predicted sugar kinase